MPVLRKAGIYSDIFTPVSANRLYIIDMKTTYTWKGRGKGEIAKLDITNGHFTESKGLDLDGVALSDDLEKDIENAINAAINDVLNHKLIKINGPVLDTIKFNDTTITDDGELR